jgi:hypothetical protein
MSRLSPQPPPRSRVLNALKIEGEMWRKKADEAEARYASWRQFVAMLVDPQIH